MQLLKPAASQPTRPTKINRVLVTLIFLIAIPPCLAGNLKRAQDLYDQAELRQKQGDLLGAVEDLNAAIIENPRFAAALNFRSMMHFRLKNYRAAIADSTAAIAINPTDADYYGNRCYMRRTTGDLAPALRDCTQAIALGLENADIYAFRAELRSDLGDRAGANADRTKSQEMRDASNVPAPGTQPTPATEAEPRIGYGTPMDLRGLTKYYVIVGGGEVALRNAMVARVSERLPRLRLMRDDDPVGAETIFLLFRGIEGQDENMGEVYLNLPGERKMIHTMRPKNYSTWWGGVSVNDQALEFVNDFIRIYTSVNGR